MDARVEEGGDEGRESLSGSEPPSDSHVGEEVNVLLEYAWHTE